MCVTLTAVRGPVGSCSVRTASKMAFEIQGDASHMSQSFQGNIFNWVKLFKRQIN